MSAGKKKCAKCKKSKPLTGFTKNRRFKDGYQRLCRCCYNEYLREYNKSRPEESAALSKKRHDKFHSTAKGRATLLCNGAKQRCVRFGLEFDLTKEWILDRIMSGHCAVTGVEFSFQVKGCGGMCNNHHAPSIDRIDRTRGYTMDNCRMTTWIYNRARGAFPDEALLEMAVALASKSNAIKTGFAVKP